MAIKHNAANNENNRMRNFPTSLQGRGNYQHNQSEGKDFMGKNAHEATYDRGNRYDSPFGPLTPLNKHVNFVNPFRNLIQLILDVRHSLLKGGNSFRKTAHQVYSRVPPPWL